MAETLTPADSGVGMEQDYQPPQNEIEVITEYNAPLSVESLQKIASGVPENRLSQNQFIFAKAAVPSHPTLTSTNRMTGVEFYGNTVQNEMPEVSGVSMANMEAFRERRNQTDMSFYQHQLIQTQKMFTEQQSMMKKLSETVNKIQENMQPSQRQETARLSAKRKRKLHEISSDDSEQSEIECGEYNSTSSEDDREQFRLRIGKRSC